MKEKMLEVLNDTVEYYSADVKRRAIEEDGTCRFLTDDGRKCAVGRYIKEDSPDEVWKQEGLSEDLLYTHPNCLTIEIPRIFWLKLQYLHDKCEFWGSETGLSEAGVRRSEEIKEWIKNYKEE
jgi:hypothetical protein